MTIIAVYSSRSMPGSVLSVGRTSAMNAVSSRRSSGSQARFGNIAVAQQAGRIADGGVAAVEQAHLGHLVGSYVAGDLRARALPLRPAGGKSIFKHPLPERLRDHRRPIEHPKVFRNGCAIFFCCTGRDAIDHTARET